MSALKVLDEVRDVLVVDTPGASRSPQLRSRTRTRSQTPPDTSPRLPRRRHSRPNVARAEIERVKELEFTPTAARVEEEGLGPASVEEGRSATSSGAESSPQVNERTKLMTEGGYASTAETRAGSLSKAEASESSAPPSSAFAPSRPRMLVLDLGPCVSLDASACQSCLLPIARLTEGLQVGEVMLYEHLPR